VLSRKKPQQDKSLIESRGRGEKSSESKVRDNEICREGRGKGGADG
jgi:hypothetical protein